MMKVKGTAIVSLPDFIRGKLGEKKCGAWLESLPPRSKTIYSNQILGWKWYPMKYAMSIPLKNMCDMFYAGSDDGAWESGRHSARVALKNVHHPVARGPPEALIKRTEKLFTIYYTPSVAEAVEVSSGRGVLRLTYFAELNTFIEARLAGYLERGLEICGAKEVMVSITSSLTKGRPYSEFSLSWI